jgi:hypothetical protein
VAFFADGGRGMQSVGGLGADNLLLVFPPCVLVTLAAYSSTTFARNRPTCVNAAFSHARASC